jgi:3-hydroxymyristoyl/3-hydroxydecanoyl-(acyl carrier protein) dehydratase
MRLLPDVRATEHPAPDTAILRLWVPADLHYLEGHFPGLPILPGVVQLHWVAHFAAEHLQVACKGSRIEQLKFLAIIRPETEVTLTLRLDSAGMLYFAYSGHERSYSSGRISVA